MGILTIEPLPKNQIKVLTSKATREKVRGLAWDGKKLPPPVLCRWGYDREKINERATNSPTDLSCKPDANKKELPLPI
jgi:hypothetical protein